MIHTQYIVGKPLSTSSGVLPSGTVIDPAGWKHLAKLIQQGYVRAVQTVDEQMQSIADAPSVRNTRQAKKGR
jgi:hypothetical protein